MLAIQTTLTNFKSLADGTIRVFFDSQELKPEEVAQIHSMRNSFGWLVFTVAEVKPETLPEPDFSTRDTAVSSVKRWSKSQQLRWIFEQIRRAKHPDVSQEDYYNMRMEKIIESYSRELTSLGG